MFRLVVLENLLTMNYSKTLKPSLVGVPYKRKECNSFYYALILIGLLLKRANGHATNDVIPNNQCKCTMSNEEHCMLLREVQNVPSNEYAFIPI